MSDAVKALLAKVEKWSDVSIPGNFNYCSRELDPLVAAVELEMANLRAEIAELKDRLALAEAVKNLSYEQIARKEEYARSLELQIAELKAGAAAVMEKLLTDVDSELKRIGVGGLVRGPLRDFMRSAIPADYAAALAEQIANAVRSRDYEWFKALGYRVEPAESTLERIVATAMAERERGARLEEAKWWTHSLVDMNNDDAKRIALHRITQLRAAPQPESEKP